MLKTKITLEKTYTIQLEDSFLDQIEVNGNVANIKMTGKDTVYTYLLSDRQKKQLINAGKNNERLGKWYNQNLRGHSLSKTVLS